MKVFVDATKCDAYANCVNAAPEVFELNDEDVATVLLPEIPAELHDKVHQAARLCPVDAITIEE